MSSFDIDFTKVTNLYSTPFTNFWGNNSQYSLSSEGLLWGSGPNNDYAEMGMMQPPSGPSAGEGFGLFSFVMRHEKANQPGGCYALLWRADNQWIVSASPGLITEMDAWETFNNSASISATTHFWASTWPGDDGYTSHQISVDPTKLHVATYVWAKGSLEYYFDEQLIFAVTGVTVPNDFANGGCNQCMGVGAETETSPVGAYLTRAKYVAQADIAGQGGVSAILAELVKAAGGTSSGTAGTTIGAPVSAPAPATPAAVAFTISSPGTVTGTAPVTVKLAATGPASSSAIAFVVGAGPAYDWLTQIPVTFDATGKATISAQLSNGQEVKLMSNTSGANAVDSGAVTIVAPKTTTPVATPTPTPAPVSTKPVPTQPAPSLPGKGLSVQDASFKGGSQLLLDFTQELGGNVTIRLNAQVAGAWHYCGTVWDRCPVGKHDGVKFSGTVPAGATTIQLYCDGNSATADAAIT